MKRYEVTINGVTPLLMHMDNIKWGERVKLWSKDPANKSKSVAGDDRSPAWTWLGYCYHTDRLIIDSDNLMTMFRDAGKKCPAARGKGSLKAATQSGIVIDQIGWPLVSAKGEIEWKVLEELVDENDFAIHEETAVELGFELFVKRAKIGQAKHVRVRPRFDKWSANGSITVLDDNLSKSTIETLLAQGGRYIGLCDWRPGCPASGRYGMFDSKIREM